MIQISRRALLLATGLTSFIGTARADLYDDYINSSSKVPFVAFLARSPSVDGPGHAYVGLGVEVDNGNVIYFGSMATM